MKKQCVLFLLFFIAFSINAHHTLLNFMQLQRWCESIAVLEKEDLLLWQDYLTLDKEMAQMCSKNTACADSDEGKTLQKKIDEVVQAIVHNHSLQQSFREFITLVKEELALNQEGEYTGQHQVKINFKVLAKVCEGCLACVHQKLEGSMQKS